MFADKLKRVIKYEDPAGFSIEIALEKLESLLKADYIITKRAIGLLLLARDAEITAEVEQKEPQAIAEIKKVVAEAEAAYNKPLEYMITLRRQEEVSLIVQKTTKQEPVKEISFTERLSQVMMEPITGIPILLLVLYFGLYKFVGGFGAGVLVDFLERTVFEKNINPFMIQLIGAISPWKFLTDLMVGEYGVITLGIRYAVAIILPLVSVFFIAFSVIEDTGYLPRLAMLIDNLFKKIGLSGRAVIPMVLGFGCDTMATMVTRTLPTKRERMIATLLLALAVPCSAQLGVIFALLGGNFRALMVWGGVILFVFAFIGFISAKIFPGERPTFYMEIPPLRIPSISNVWTKTYTRVKWYMKEVLPLFIIVSFFIWVGQITRIFDVLIWLLKPAVHMIGLPPEAAAIFLFGFFRRDYGAAGLYDLNKTGALTGVQLVVACVALTLFLPCIAQFMINIKERGIKAGIFISAFVLVVSFTIAYILNKALLMLGVSL